MKLENFDELFTGHPEEIENNLRKLLPQANSLENKSLYLQILSQIALAQAMQKKFDVAHATLDMAEASLEPEYSLARVRILLERGRVFHQADNMDAALPLFKESYELSAENGFDCHTVNAAHMIAIVIKDINEKISWNLKAISLAEKTDGERCLTWLSVLHNNLAQNYIEAEQYQNALFSFEKCKEYAEKKEEMIVMRGAKWGIARSLRSLNKLDEAFNIQISLLKEYDDIVQNKTLPMGLIVVGRGMVYEELAEIYLAHAKKYAEFAYHDLSQDPWCAKLIPERLEKMKQLHLNGK